MNINFIFPYDYILIILTAITLIFSTWKGVIQSILGLMTWIGSILITLYTYNSFSNFLNSQLLKINFLQNYESVSIIMSIILSIPIIFLISLFILKRIRKVISSDLDKQILGIIFDKFFGFIYGLIFSYFIFSTILFILYKLNFESLSFWLINNSEILNKINSINNTYFYNIINFNNLN